MRYNLIREMDISNGPGIRVALFTQGCPFHCKGCFNESTWDFDGGEQFTEQQIDKIIELCSKPYIKGLSILGGEPLIRENLFYLKLLTHTFKEKYPNKTIWLWTGNSFENLNLENPDLMLILSRLDVLVDGQFKEDLKDPHLKYCGSSNQRVIDVKKSLEKGAAVLYDIY